MKCAARLFFATVLCGVLAWTTSAEAGTVGVLLERDTPYHQAAGEAFEEALQEKVAGTRVLIQRPGANKIAHANALQRLTTLNVDVIVTLGTTVTRSAVNIKRTAPLAFFLSRPGNLQIPPSAHMVGLTWEVPIAKAFDLLGELKTTNKIGVVHAGGSDARREWKAVPGLAASRKLDPTLIDLRSKTLEADLEGVGGIYVTGNAEALDALGPLMKLASEKKIPVVATAAGAEEAGVLVALSADPVAVGQGLAELAVQLLEGKHPMKMATRPIEGNQTLVNTGAAKAMGLTLPPALVKSATRLLE